MAEKACAQVLTHLTAPWQLMVYLMFCFFFQVNHMVVLVVPLKCASSWFILLDMDMDMDMDMCKDCSIMCWISLVYFISSDLRFSDFFRNHWPLWHSFICMNTSFSHFLNKCLENLKGWHAAHVPFIFSLTAWFQVK